MAVVKRITGDDGKLIGFIVDGELLSRPVLMDETNELRSLANAVMHILMNCERDTESKEAKELIAEDQARLRVLKIIADLQDKIK